MSSLSEDGPVKKSSCRIPYELYKVVLIGDSTVGKTGLLSRFADDPQIFRPTLPTVGIDFKVRNIELRGRRIKLQIWDTAGSERFRTMTTAFYRGTQGLLVVYDLTNLDSFEHVRGWITLFRESPLTDAGIPTMLIGNKADREKERRVSRRQGELLAKTYGMKFLETSALTGENVNEVFLTLAADMWKYRDAKLKTEDGIKADAAGKKLKLRPGQSKAPTSKFSAWLSKCHVL